MAFDKKVLLLFTSHVYSFVNFWSVENFLNPLFLEETSWNPEVYQLKTNDFYVIGTLHYSTWLTKKIKGLDFVSEDIHALDECIIFCFIFGAGSLHFTLHNYKYFCANSSEKWVSFSVFNYNLKNPSEPLSESSSVLFSSFSRFFFFCCFQSFNVSITFKD